MKRQEMMVAAAALVLVGAAPVVQGGETSVAGFATYWDGTVGGYGGGIKVRKKFLGFFAADVRASHVDFGDSDTSVIPLEATVMVGFPFVVEPYAGLGVGYYLVDSGLSIDSGTGGYGVVGLQLNLWVVGAMAELRWNETEEDLMDGMSANLGLMVKW